MSLLLKFAPYIAAAALGAAVSGYLTHKADGVPLAHLQAEYAGYKAQVADDKEKAEKAAADALAKELADHHRIEVANDKIVADMQRQLGTTAADRDGARRLLDAARTALTTPGSCALPAGPDKPVAPFPGPSSGDGRLAELLADAKAECRANAAQLDALIEEIKPQTQ